MRAARLAGAAGLALAVLSGCGGAGNRPESRPGACGVPGLVAEARPAIRQGQCGIADPVFVTRVAGIGLENGALVSCPTARALDRWTRRAAIPAVGRRGGGLMSMNVAASYACRTRNSQGGRLSEHARGNAIDISSFGLRDGSRISVEAGWRGAEGPLLRRLHGAACGLFGTVLGPDSDPFHRDHFHFDVAGYRSGPFCR